MVCILLAFGSLVAGTFFIFEGPGTNVSFLAGSSCFGGDCPQNYESVVFDAIGILLAYLSLPTALFAMNGETPKWFQVGSWLNVSSDSESTLLSDKRISGMSLLFAGSVQLAFSLFGLYFYLSILENAPGPFDYSSPSIFSPGFTENWIFIFVGFLLVAVGVTLILMSKAPNTVSPGVQPSLSSEQTAS
jgi:hypothetical protein